MTIEVWQKFFSKFNKLKIGTLCAQLKVFLPKETDWPDGLPSGHFLPKRRIMPTLVLLRHGQSAWNLENRFTGWWDVNLTDQGVVEATAAGRSIVGAGIAVDEAFVSVQTRAIKTLNLALEAMGRLWVPVTKDWHLNERHYGGLTGLNKAETIEKHGEEQVKLWRRSFDVPPPPIEKGSEYDLSTDPRYAGVDVPAAESLKDTIARVLPYYQAVVEPRLRAGKTVIIAAHGNSLRALVKHLSGLSDDEIVHEEIPTGKPLVYRLDGDFRVESRAYLG